MKNNACKTVSQSKKIGGITYKVKSVFDLKSVTDKMENLIEKKIVKSSVKE